MTDESTALVQAPSAGIVRASGDVVQALHEYQGIQKALDEAMPDCIQMIQTSKGPKPFRKKMYWRAIATAFNLDVQLVDEKRIAEEPTPNDWGYVVTYRATAPNGRHADGDGSCFAMEKSYAAQRTVHNVRSHAHTRAFNRAVSNLVGFGEVSAEEAEKDEHPSEPGSHDGPPPAKKSSPAPSSSGMESIWQGVLKDVRVVNGVSKSSGKPYTKYVLVGDDSPEMIFNTFDRKHADFAREAGTSHVVIKFNKTKFGLEVDFIGPAE